MKKIYIYDIGDIVDDLECIDIIKPIKGSGKNCRYTMKCTKCGREKSMIGDCINKHKGTTHEPIILIMNIGKIMAVEESVVMNLNISLIFMIQCMNHTLKHVVFMKKRMFR